MLISLVIFSFGLMISFIVALGIVNAREIRIRQRAHDFHLDKLHDPMIATQTRSEGHAKVDTKKPQLV